jgi:ferredoxin-type protein NapG
MGRPNLSRRKLVRTALGAGAAVCVLGARVRGEKAELPRNRLRPPGALPETAFLQACVRCGLCAQACPYGTLRLAELGHAVPTGTPYFVARDNPCRMCKEMPCVPACPTGALQRTLTDVRDAEMGTAALTAPQRCLSHVGAAYCDSCLRACPLRGTAIRMLRGRGDDGRIRFTPTVDSAACTGCGLCEQSCVLDGVAAITVHAAHAAPRPT